MIFLKKNPLQISLKNLKIGNYLVKNQKLNGKKT
jgi:hypothetical protein